jgi:hypothetical protein
MLSMTSPKEHGTIVYASRDEIRAGLRIIVAWRTKGAAARTRVDGHWRWPENLCKPPLITARSELQGVGLKHASSCIARRIPNLMVRICCARAGLKPPLHEPRSVIDGGGIGDLPSRRHRKLRGIERRPDHHLGAATSFRRLKWAGVKPGEDMIRQRHFHDVEQGLFVRRAEQTFQGTENEFSGATSNGTILATGAPSMLPVE